MLAGKYRARANAVAMGTTSTGKEQIIVAFLTEGGESISWYGYFSDRTWERTVESLRVCGWTGDDLTDFDGGALAGLDTHDVEIVVEEEPDLDGVPRARVRWVNMLRGSGIAVKQPLAGTELKSFAAQMRGKILALDKSASKPSKPSSTGQRKRPEPSNNRDLDDAPPF
jgi:hypothetical protein